MKPEPFLPGQMGISIGGESIPFTMQAEASHMTIEEAVASGLFDMPDEPGMVRIPISLTVMIPNHLLWLPEPEPAAGHDPVNSPHGVPPQAPRSPLRRRFGDYPKGTAAQRVMESFRNDPYLIATMQLPVGKAEDTFAPEALAGADGLPSHLTAALTGVRGQGERRKPDLDAVGIGNFSAGKEATDWRAAYLADVADLNKPIGSDPAQHPDQVAQRDDVHPKPGLGAGANGQHGASIDHPLSRRSQQAPSSDQAGSPETTYAIDTVYKQILQRVPTTDEMKQARAGLVSGRSLTDLRLALVSGIVKSAGRNAAIPLVDDKGSPVIGGNEVQAHWPAGLEPHFFVTQGLHDAAIERQLVESGGTGAEAAVAYRSAALANFRHGGSWDAQRLNGTFDNRFVDYATIAIGLYAASSGIPRDEILLSQNIVATLNHYAPDTKFDKSYRFLPERNLRNTDIGYELYRSHRIRPDGHS